MISKLLAICGSTYVLDSLNFDAPVPGVLVIFFCTLSLSCTVFLLFLFPTDSFYAPYIQQAGQYSGPSGYSGFMSPYQQEVIDTTLTEYDKQAQIGQQGIMDQATRMNALGAGRTGVQLAEYQSGSDAKRAMLQAQML